MDGGFDANLKNEEEETTTVPENAANSPLSGEDLSLATKRRKRSLQKRVVAVPINGVDGTRGKGEVYPPSDSWSWRKYGQKPIKGSPYPRGYYRCSSTKGCPARKQVERSPVDPTTLLVTYSSDHNHPPSSNAAARHHHHAAADHPTAAVISVKSPEELSSSANQSDFETENNSYCDLADNGWFSDLSASAMFDRPVLVGPSWEDVDMTITVPSGEEDDALFGDLGELPECSVVFRRCNIETPCCGST